MPKKKRRIKPDLEAFFSRNPKLRGSMRRDARDYAVDKLEGKMSGGLTRGEIKKITNRFKRSGDPISDADARLIKKELMREFEKADEKRQSRSMIRKLRAQKAAEKKAQKKAEKEAAKAAEAERTPKLSAREDPLVGRPGDKPSTTGLRRTALSRKGALSRRVSTRRPRKTSRR